MSLNFKVSKQSQLRQPLHSYATYGKVRQLHDFAASEGGISAEERQQIQYILASGKRKSARESHNQAHHNDGSN